MCMTDLKGRVAVVTGASSGIGQAVARKLVGCGTRVVINGRRRERVEGLLQELNHKDGHAVSVIGDASDPEIIETLLKSAEVSFGRPADIFIVNAGRGLGGSVVTSDIGQWEEVFRTNVEGALRLMRSAAISLSAEAAKEKWPGHPRDIVILGSVAGRHISPFSALYGTSKFAIGSAAEALRRELGPKGIRVTLIEPAIVKSGFQAVAGYDEKWFSQFEAEKGPFLVPEDIADAIAMVISQPAHVHISDLLIRPTRQDYP